MAHPRLRLTRLCPYAQPRHRSAGAADARRDAGVDLLARAEVDRVGRTARARIGAARDTECDTDAHLAEPSVEDVLPPREAVAEPQFAEAEMESEIESAPRPATPRIIPPKKKPLVTPKVEAENPKREKGAAAAKQEILQFEPITRGRFEKSEPTIVEGQDLDVPTFLRKNVRVK